MPDRIGHYKVVGKLGRGGMGVVYKAHEESLNRYVAIKLLGEHLIEDEQFLARFTREAQSAASLSHPNIVQIYFIGEDDGRHYFVMEYVSGKPLDAIIQKVGRIDATHATQITLQASQGLAAAHDSGIIHRDIKPANLILDERGIVKITDFGLALPSQIQSRLTATGMLMGTPGYMAPEQCKGEQADHRTDIYALGVTLYEMLTGNVPFEAESPLVLLKQIMEEEPPDVTSINPEVDRQIIAILDRMIAKEREDRHQSAHELIEELEDYLADRGIRTMSKGLAGLVAIGAPVEGSADQTVALDGATAPQSSADVPTEVTPAAAATEPDLPSGAPPTEPAAAPPPPPPPPPPEQNSNLSPGSTPHPSAATPAAMASPHHPASAQSEGQKRSKWLPALLVLLVLFVLAGGALAAFFVFTGGDDEARPEAVAGDSPEPMDGRTAVDPESIELSAPIETGRSRPDEVEGPGSEATAAETSPSLVPEREVDGASQQPPPPSPVERRAEARSPEAVPGPRSAERTSPAVAEEAPAAPRLEGIIVAVSGDPGLNQYVADGLISRFEAFGL
ncbi:MAG: protein kinase, partial [Thermoanaerobaculia bacterium]|nr:protein kinase [Thermoanaerobaculia bacterium]